MEEIKDHVQLFMLFKECTRTHFYTKENDEDITLELLQDFFYHLDTALAHIQIENYEGFFDLDNIEAFLANYDILDDYYPVSPRKKLRQSLRNWRSWKSQRESDSEEEYKIEGTPTKNGSFGEIHARQTKASNNKYLVVSDNSICFCNQTVTVAQTSNGASEQIECIELKDELEKWFNGNRIPARIYNESSKHGENGRGEWRNASKLLCSHTEAKEMLAKAIGLNGIDELYYYDAKNGAYIIFRYEGDTGENKFHAYHLSERDNIDKSIKERLQP